DFIGFKLIVEELPEGSDLKAFSDGLKDKLRDQIAVILCKKADKLSLLTVVGRELQGVYHAGNIVKAIAATLDGKGGGRADSAMGGGNNPGDLEPLIARIPEIIKGL
ncbi:MAG: DHHA1 domain-containing protein, partial [Candidatus Cloacimonetes bacterium]|nr:DHHA1 domain-containing protein [Candidatus Cloacimonadota bacterium]